MQPNDRDAIIAHSLGVRLDGPIDAPAPQQATPSGPGAGDPIKAAAARWRRIVNRGRDTSPPKDPEPAEAPEDQLAGLPDDHYAPRGPAALPTARQPAPRRQRRGASCGGRAVVPGGCQASRDRGAVAGAGPGDGSGGRDALRRGRAHGLEISMLPTPKTPTRAGTYTIPEALLGLTEDQVRRKGEQKGSVRRKGADWYVQFHRWTTDADGNMKYAPTERKIEGKFRTESQAQAAGYEQHVKAANELTRVPQGMATVRQFIKARFQQDHIDLLKKSGKIHYRTYLDNHVLPSIGDTQMRDVTPQLVQALISSKLAAGYSAQTLAHIRNVISAVFMHARNLRFYQGQLPTEGVRLPEINAKQRSAMTWEQVQLLIAALPERYRPLVTILAQTGMRIGEACGLLWRHVNLTDDWKIVQNEALPPNSILVCDNWTRSERTTLKNKRFWRKVPMTAESWVAFMEQWEASKFRGEDQPVFASRIGTPMDAHNVATRVLKPKAVKIGIPWACFHVLRHTTATLADKAGLTIAEKQKILGHATARMSTHYTHPEMERVRQAMEQMTAKTPGKVVEMPVKKGA